jgi:hypothetical protein
MDNHWTADCTVPKPDKVKVPYFKKLQEDRNAAARRDNKQNDHNNATKSEPPLNGQPNGPSDHHLNTDNNPAPLNHANQFPTTWSDTTREICHRIPLHKNVKYVHGAPQLSIIFPDTNIVRETMVSEIGTNHSNVIAQIRMTINSSTTIQPASNPTYPNCDMIMTVDSFHPKNDVLCTAVTAA